MYTGAEFAPRRPNLVMRQMGYTVARKHALRLRQLAQELAFSLPLAVMALILAGARGGFWLALMALVSLAAGLLIERWPFFAEAEHVSMLSCGRAAA